MKRAALFHPCVFYDQQWADRYYRRNAKKIEQTGKRFVRLLQNSGFKQGKILDVGCGFGSVAIEIAKNFNEVEITGIDLSRPLIQLGQSLAEKADVADRVVFAESDVQQMNFGTNSFDLVINTFLLHIVDEPLSMLNQIERVTKPQGAIILTDLRRGLPALFVKKLKTAFTLDEAKEIIDNSWIRSGKYSKGLYRWDYMINI